MAQSSQPDFQKKSSPAPVAAPSQAMAPRPFAPQVDVATPDVQAPDVAVPDAPALDSAPAFPKLNFHIRTAGGSPPPIQPKLTIGAPNDKYEQEADRVAAQVVQRIHLPAANLPTQNRTYQAQSVQRQAGPEQPVLKMKSMLQREALPDDELQMKPLTGQIQRMDLPEDDELQMNPFLQRQGSGAVAASDDLESGIQQSRGSGQPLSDSIRGPMEQAFGGVDFGGVKVHTDGRSDQLNRSIQAKAFTTGQDIFFRQGAYEPGSRGGQELIAHELTHTLQQGESIQSKQIQRKGVNELVDDFQKVMPEGKLKKEQIIEGLKKLQDQDLQDLNFSHALVEFVKQRNESKFSIEDLKSVKVPVFAKKHLNKKWTFRHYTTQKFDKLRSLAELEAKDINAGKNTNDRDWEELGNQGYVFGLIAIDGQVPARKWLSKMSFYAEYDLDNLDSIWVSGDMLTEEGRMENSYRGSGKLIKEKLAAMLGFIDNKPAIELDAKFKGVLEAKVPSSCLNKPDWKDT